MELVTQYVQGLMQAILAGADVRSMINGKSLSVIHIRINQEAKNLAITYLENTTPFDKTTTLPLRSVFTVEFNDYPNDLRDTGWK